MGAPRADGQVDGQVLPVPGACLPQRARGRGASSFWREAFECSREPFLCPISSRSQNKYYVEHKALPTLQEAATRAFKDVVFAVLKVRRRGHEGREKRWLSLVWGEVRVTGSPWSAHLVGAHFLAPAGGGGARRVRPDQQGARRRADRPFPHQAVRGGPGGGPACGLVAADATSLHALFTQNHSPLKTPLRQPLRTAAAWRCLRPWARAR